MLALERQLRSISDLKEETGKVFGQEADLETLANAPIRSHLVKHALKQLDFKVPKTSSARTLKEDEELLKMINLLQGGSGSATSSMSVVAKQMRVTAAPKKKKQMLNANRRHPSCQNGLKDMVNYATTKSGGKTLSSQRNKAPSDNLSFMVTKMTKLNSATKNRE